MSDGRGDGNGWEEAQEEVEGGKGENDFTEVGHKFVCRLYHFVKQVSSFGIRLVVGHGQASSRNFPKAWQYRRLDKINY